MNRHRCGNEFFRLGKQKSVKNNHDCQIHCITLCNMYFPKKVGSVQLGLGQGPRSWETFGEFLYVRLL